MALEFQHINLGGTHTISGIEESPIPAKGNYTKEHLSSQQLGCEGTGQVKEILGQQPLQEEKYNKMAHTLMYKFSSTNTLEKCK